MFAYFFHKFVIVSSPNNDADTNNKVSVNCRFHNAINTIAQIKPTPPKTRFELSGLPVVNIPLIKLIILYGKRDAATCILITMHTTDDNNYNVSVKNKNIIVRSRVFGISQKSFLIKKLAGGVI